MTVLRRIEVPAELWDGYVARCKKKEKDPYAVLHGWLRCYGRSDPAVELRKLMRGSRLRGAEYQARKLELQVELERQERLRKESEGEEE